MKGGGEGGRSCNLLLRRHLVLSPVYNTIKVLPLGAPSFVNNLGVCAGLPDGGRKPSLIEFVNHVMIYENTYAFVMLIKSKLDLIRNMEVNSSSLYHIFVAVVLCRAANV